MIHSGIAFAALLILNTACGGTTAISPPTSSSGAIPFLTPVHPTLGTIGRAVSAAVNEPYIAGNTVQYYCGCTGPGQSCAPSAQGNDSTGKGTQANPYQTLDKAMAWLTGAANRTVALCQGGSFTSANTGQFVYILASTTCVAGSICNEVREYPIAGTGAKPIINNVAGYHSLFNFPYSSSAGGYRFMNLKLQGTWDTTSGQQNIGFFIYSSLPTHDISIENVDLDSFNIAIQDAVSSNNNITIVGNHFTNSAQFGYLGSSQNLSINYNSFVNNGSDNTFDHAVYFGTDVTPVNNVSFVGNYATGFSTASSNTNCLGTVFQGHAAITGLNASYNIVVQSITAGDGCYGFEFSNTTNSMGAIFLRDAIFSSNIVVNGGSSAIHIDTCPYCLIENNLVIFQNNTEGTGIASPADPARTQDDVEANAKIVNNTIYFDTASAQGMHGGVVVGTEGTGYTVANNTVMYAGATDGLNQIQCFTYTLPLSSYSLINNNNCYSNNISTKWAFNGTTQYLLADWEKYTATAGLSGAGFDNSTKSSYANPGWSFSTPLTIPAFDETKTGAQLFAPYFTPPAGSPLVGTGNAASAPVLDIANTARPTIPSVGAYE